MKVLHVDEYKYFFTAKDRKLVKESMRGHSYKVLARAMGFSYKTLWSKLQGNDKEQCKLDLEKAAYFDQSEIECLQVLLNIELKRE